jgi:hypothetical protein
MTSGGGGDEANASATVNEEHPETPDEVFETQKNDNGDKQNK